jgi:hypothetical protein
MIDAGSGQIRLSGAGAEVRSQSLIRVQSAAKLADKGQGPIRVGDRLRKLIFRRQYVNLKRFAPRRPNFQGRGPGSHIWLC